MCHINFISERAEQAIKLTVPIARVMMMMMMIAVPISEHGIKLNYKVLSGIGGAPVHTIPPNFIAFHYYDVETIGGFVLPD